MKVIEGYKAYRALKAINVLILGLKMLPAYQHFTYEEFGSVLDAMTEEDQEKTIRAAANFVDLTEDEVIAIISFAIDKNGVPYGVENINNLNPYEIMDLIVQVGLRIVKIKTDLVTNEEKKNLKILV